MSSEHQRFSPDNQATVNAAYAIEHGYEIVATYQDLGKSGLNLKARPGLKQLLSDVLSGAMAYKAILVLDVSRWGRFQDSDQAAHYEYLCREAGIPVQYCCEAFENDGGSMASIVKHMKRVMAAEYSRELSTKIARAQRQQAGLGFKQGGIAPYGTRRIVVDEHGRTCMILAPGQRKALTTHKVVFGRGTIAEVNVVRRIFEMYGEQGLTLQEICNWLASAHKHQRNGNPFNRRNVSDLLRNEIYLGTYVFGRVANNLGNLKHNPTSLWVKTAVMEPMVPEALFQASAARLARETRSRAFTEDEIKQGLKRLLHENGFISGELIDACPFLPTQSTLSRRFRGLKNACLLINYSKPARATKRFRRHFTDDDLLEELRRIHSANGTLTKRLIDADESTPSSSHFARRLGGLLESCVRAGIEDENLSERHIAWKWSLRFTDEELLEGLRGVLARHGHITAKLINADPSIPNVSHYDLRFGRLGIAYARIGYLRNASEIHRAAWERRRRA
jgi:DNA invertase Pin-like site-specific DNA recombinase